MSFIYDDGGRSAAGYLGTASDCFVRSAAIVSGRSYADVYAMVRDAAAHERTGSRKRGVSSPREGVHKYTRRLVMASLGFRWHPTMQIGSGCKVHLQADELPAGRIVVEVSKHCTAVIDGVIHDTFDPRRQTLIAENGVERIAGRCVYGYWKRGSQYR